MADDYLFDEGEHLFGPVEIREYMTNAEKEALVTTFRLSEYRLVIDPILIADKLFAKGIIQTEHLNYTIVMRAQGRRNWEILNYLMPKMSDKASMQSIVRVLIECGYEELAAELYSTYLNVGGTRHDTVRCHSEPRSALRRISRIIKSEVHNVPFGDRGQHLRKKEDRCLPLMLRENNPRKRQCLADVCLTIIGGEIDAMAITFNNELHNNDIFKRYEAIIHESSDSAAFNIGFLGRWANACAIAGEFAEAEEKLAQARCLAVLVGPSLEVFNFFYTEIYTRLWHFEQNPSDSLRESILFWGNCGLKCLEGETDSYALISWKTNYMLRMSLCLLGLGNTTKPIIGCVVDKKCIQTSGLFIQELSRPEIRDNIQLRRVMLFYIVKARWLEVCAFYEKSLENYNNARKLAERANFDELKVINDHIKRVSDMLFVGVHEDEECNTVPTSNTPPFSERNYLHVQQLKELSLEERGEPSGTSEPDEIIEIAHEHYSGERLSALDPTYTNVHDSALSRSTEMKCLISRNVSHLNLQCNQVMSPLNLQCDENIHASPLNLELDIDKHKSSLNLQLNESIHTPSLSLQVEENKHVSPLNLQLGENKPVSPLNLQLDENKPVSPLNVHPDESNHVSPLNLQLDKNKELVSPLHLHLEENSLVSPFYLHLDENKHTSPLNLQLCENMPAAPLHLQLDESIHVSPLNLQLNENLNVAPLNLGSKENINLLNPQCDKHSDFADELKLRVIEQSVADEKPIEERSFSSSSDIPMAMHYESANMLTDASETDCKRLISTDDTKQKLLMSNTSFTDTKRVISVDTGVIADQEQQDDVGTEINQDVDFGVRYQIPSWEREPPSGQSTD